MKPAELAAQIAETIQAATADNTLVYADRELTSDELGDLELAIARVFDVARSQKRAEWLNHLRHEKPHPDCHLCVQLARRCVGMTGQL